MMKCKADCLFNFDGKCTKQSKKDMTVIGKWKNDFKGFISELSMPEDDFYGIMQYIDEAPNEPKWIPVSERLPEDRREVLVTAYWHETYQVMMASYFDDDLWWCVPFNNCGEHMQRLKPKAWMPLPKPYKPQESEE